MVFPELFGYFCASAIAFAGALYGSTFLSLLTNVKRLFTFRHSSFPPFAHPLRLPPYSKKTNRFFSSCLDIPLKYLYSNKFPSTYNPINHVNSLLPPSFSPQQKSPLQKPPPFLPTLNRNIPIKNH